MPLASCGRCGKMFNKVQANVCPGCIDDEEADYEKIRDVVSRNETLNVEQVSEAAGVDVLVVRRIIGEGRVAQVSLGEVPKCGKCGAPAISITKKLCQACLERMNVEVSKAQSQIKLEKKKETQIGAYDNNARKTFEAKRK
jgi:ribosomal protein L37E